MREIREHVRRIHALGRAAQCLRRIALLGRNRTRRLRQFLVVVDDRAGAARFGVGEVPGDVQCFTALLGRPGVFADDGDAVRHLHHVDDALDLLCCRGVEALHRAAEFRRTRQHRGQHAGQIDVERELRRAVGLGVAVETRRRLADQAVGRGVFRLHTRGYRRQRGSSSDELRVGRAAVRRGVAQRAFAGFDFAGRHVPCRRRDLDQHRACGCTRRAQFVPAIGDRTRSAGALHAEQMVGIQLGVGRRAFRAHFAPVGVELFGDDGGEAGIGALAHLEMFRQHRDGAVGRNAQECVGCEILSRCRCSGGGTRPSRIEIEADHQAGGSRTGKKAATADLFVCEFHLFILAFRATAPRRGSRRGYVDRWRNGRHCRSSPRRCRRRSASCCLRAKPSRP